MQQNWVIALRPYSDNRILDDMCAVAQQYVALEKTSTEQECQQLQLQFEALRNQLRDSVLKEYSSFKFLTQLYSIEHIFESE